jgi:hypothetical protein
MHKFPLLVAIPVTLAAQYQGAHTPWIEPGANETLPSFDVFDNYLGKLGIINATGPVATTGHPFKLDGEWKITHKLFHWHND